jgi:hypothetical protein
MTVFAATERDLAAIRSHAPEIADSALAATALSLAAEMDADNSATSKSMCARALADILQQLKALVPEEVKGDGIDEIAARRAKRLGSAAPKAS